MAKRGRLGRLLAPFRRRNSAQNETRQSTLKSSSDPATAEQTHIPATCSNCHNLDPNDSELIGELYMWSSSLLGGPPSSTCRFCQFIYDAATLIVPSLASEAQIHASLQVIPKYNRIDLSFGRRLSIQVYTRFLDTSANCKSQPSESLLSLTDDHASLEKEDGSIGDSFEFVKRRLEHCKQYHSDCFQQSPTFQPSRLIHCADNTGRLQLLEHDQGSKNLHPVEFVALSYCWGAASFFNTTRTNIDRLKQGFDLSVLPQTLQDAIKVTQQLGIAYIWIDALCIIQDDAADWEKESGMMADVYSNAHLTLAAFSAASVAEGFLHLERSPALITRSLLDEHGATTVLTAREKIRTGLHASSLRHGWSPLMGAQEDDSDPVQKRGWCFQEEILSRRFVAFSRHEIQWSCKSALGCQCGPVDPDGDTAVLPQTQSLQDDPFRFWASMLPAYTKRSLSFPKDRLPAISGLARQIQRLTSADYVAGIWLQDLRRSLGWKLQDEVRPCPSTYRAPSFSWASIDSPVFMYTEADSRLDIVSVVGWDVRPRGREPLGEIKHASLRVTGFVHTAVVTHKPDSLEGFEFRVHVADENAVLEEDTHLVKFQTERGLAGGDDGPESCWSVRRSKEEVKHARGEWGPGVAVLALCLRVGDKAAEFLVFGQSPDDPTKLERIGCARFCPVEFEEFLGEVTDERHRRTVTLV